jgi:hypothetical protein
LWYRIADLARQKAGLERLEAHPKVIERVVVVRRPVHGLGQREQKRVCFRDSSDSEVKFVGGSDPSPTDPEV